MAKIISRDPSFEKRCGNCGVTFSYACSEMYTGAKMPHDPDGDYYGVVDCPGCNRAVNVGRVDARTVEDQRYRDDCIW